MDYIIEVTISGEGTARSASANPVSLPLTVGGQIVDIKPGDRVAWLFSGAHLGELEVVFVAESDLFLVAGKLQESPRPNAGRSGPFITLTTGKDHVKGTIDSIVPTDVNPARRYCYKIFEDHTPLPWDPPSLNTKGSPFDIPRIPP